MTNNNKDTLRDWIAERLEIVEPEGPLEILGLEIVNAGGDSRDVYTLKRDSPRWGSADTMAELFWTQAFRTAKGLPGFSQFQMAAVYGANGKPKALLPFGIMGATQLGPAAGGTAFAGMATEAPNGMGQVSQGMRLTELIVQTSQQALIHVVNVLQRSNEKKDERADVMEKRMDEQWLALKNALLEIQNNAATQAMKAVQLELTRKVITLLPGLANMLSGKELFPEGVVQDSMFDTIVRNFGAEEQQGLVQLVQSHPQGKILGGVFTDALLRAKRRYESEQSEIDRATKGVITKPGTYEEGENDAAGRINRVLQGGAYASAEKALPEKKEESNGGSTPALEGDTDIVIKLLKNTSIEQIKALGSVLGQDLVDKIVRRYDELRASGQL